MMADTQDDTSRLAGKRQAASRGELFQWQRARVRSFRFVDRLARLGPRRSADAGTADLPVDRRGSLLIAAGRSPHGVSVSGLVRPVDSASRYFVIDDWRTRSAGGLRRCEPLGLCHSIAAE